MKLLFMNPAGAWFLLGIPVLILIHSLQDKVRDQWIAALFLWEIPKPESLRGRLWREFRSSKIFWLQTLLVLLLSWMVSDPRWIHPVPLQRIFILLDGSASMNVFTKETEAELTKLIQEVGPRGKQTEWMIRRSDTGASLYQDRADAPQAADLLKNWRPLSHHHSFETLIESGLQWTKNGGGVYVITDREPDVPDRRVGWRLVGRSLANVGFVGLSFDLHSENKRWRVFIKNFSNQPAQRQCQWRDLNGTKILQKVSLQANALVEIQGLFPEGIDRGWIELEKDDFTLDDAIPIQIPKQDRFILQLKKTSIARDFFEKWGRSSDGLLLSSEVPGRRFYVTDYLPGNDFASPEDPEILIYSKSGSSHKLDTLPILADQHPLVRDLEWKGLLTGGPGYATLAAGDLPLLWQGEKPLIFLKKKPQGFALFLNFEWQNANAERCPPLIVLLNRYVRWSQEQFQMARSGNFLTESQVSWGKMAAHAQFGRLMNLDASSWTVEKWNGNAPLEPGFFELRDSSKTLFKGAAIFEDSIESDFRHQKTGSILSEYDLQWKERSLEKSASSPWIILLMILLLATTWMIQTKEAR